MEEIKKEIFEYPLNYPFDHKNDLYEETHIKEMKEDFSDSDDGIEVKFLLGQELPVVDTLKECLVNEDSEEISLKEEVSEEFLHTEMNFSVSSDVLCENFKNSLPNTASEVLQQDLQEKDSEEISLKEEVSEEFLHTEMNFSVSSDVLCAKFKNSLPNIASEVLQQDLQEKEEQYFSATDLKIFPISCGIIKSAAKPVNHEEKSPTDVNSRSSTHTAKKLFKCDLCPYQGTAKRLLKRHIFRHTGEKPFKCKLYPYQAVNPKSSTHTAKELFKCDICPYQGTTKKLLKKHIVKHTGEKPFQCELCPYQAVRKGDIKRHFIIHTDRKPFKCDLCPYQTARKDYVKRHALTHTDQKPFKCDFCPYKAVRKGDIKQHSIIHTDRKSFKCLLCPYQATIKRYVKRHALTHTDHKPFKCDLCPYQATRKTIVKRHALTHAAQKPFKCDLCPYQAVRKEYIKQHSIIHTGKKPLKCELCSYQAATKIQVKRHMLRHSEKNPFKCSQ